MKNNWAIFPLVEGTKIPATPNGFKDARPNYPIPINSNMGIATGAVSGLVVVDIDKKSGGLETLKTLNLPPTLVVETGGGGFHFYYKYPEGRGPIRNRTGLYPGVDIRADGGYVVGPGSRTENDYSVAPGPQEPADLPIWLLEKLVEPKKPDNVINLITLPGVKGKLSYKTLDFIQNGAPTGTWNMRLYKAAKDYQEQGYTKEEFVRAATNITGHLDPKDLSTIESAFNNDPKYMPRVDTRQAIKDVILQSHLITNVADLRQKTFIDLQSGAIQDLDPNILKGYLSEEELTDYQKKNCLDAVYEYNPRLTRAITINEDTGINHFNLYSPPVWRKDNYYHAAPIDKLDKLPDIYDRFFTHLTNGHDESKEYLLDWISNSLRSRNFTILTAIGEEGVGKGILGAMLETLHGPSNFALCSDTVLKEKFNGKLLNKTLVYVDEIALDDKSSHDRMKAVVNEHLEIEMKGVDAITARNYANFYISSNHMDAIRLGPADRRYSIIQLTETKIKDTPLRDLINTEILNEINLISLARYLFFRPTTHDMLQPFRSARFDEILSAGLADWEMWLIEEFFPQYEGKEPFSIDFLREALKDQFKWANPPSRRKIDALRRKYPKVFSIILSTQNRSKRMIRVF